MKKGNWERRTKALEAKRPAGMAAEAEAEFWDAVHAKRDCFEPEHAGMDEAARVARLSPLQHLAWNLRFTGEADFEATLALYGRGNPAQGATEMAQFCGWELLTEWIPGD